jgi:hypothetical protein
MVRVWPANTRPLRIPLLVASCATLIPKRCAMTVSDSPGGRYFCVRAGLPGALAQQAAATSAQIFTYHKHQSSGQIAPCGTVTSCSRAAGMP